MGLIRKTLMVGTAGLVRGSSKKQRVAKAQLKQVKEQTAIARQQLAMDQQRALSETTAPQPGAPAAGWFPDQSVPGQLRYFDGQRWTDQTARVG
jgi:Protein of unknown function (DUF2510)